MTNDDRPEPPSLFTDEDPDADWRVEPSETTGEILALYRGECARSREIAAASSLDEVAPTRGASAVGAGSWSTWWRRRPAPTATPTSSASSSTASPGSEPCRAWW